MKYILYWDIPVDKRRDAMLAYSEVVSRAEKGMELDLYWTADSSGGQYRGIGILQVDSDEALYEFFGIVQGVAEVRVVPAVAGDEVMKMWERELGEGATLRGRPSPPTG